MISHVLEKIIKHLSLLCIFFLVISLIQFDKSCIGENYKTFIFIMYIFLSY
jgi:hypothetical protein